MSPADDKNNNSGSCSCHLAIASVKPQPYKEPGDLSLAFIRGTLFDDLYFPFFAGGQHNEQPRISS